MSANFKLPKKNVDSVVVLNTPTAASDVVLALGKLTLLDEAGNTGLAVKWSDVLGAKKTAYAAGTANVKTVDFTSVSLSQFNTVKMTIDFPNTVNFFQGGRETQAIYALRTYVVSVDATPTATELAAAFRTAIQNDPESGVTVSVSGAVLTITSISANAGAILLNVPTGAVVSNTTAYVAPSGTPAEVALYANGANVLATATYTRYELSVNKAITHNAIPGLTAYKPVRVFLYVNAGDSGAAAYATKLDSILDGTFATTAAYLGTPLL
jgi:hypothetical protein